MTRMNQSYGINPLRYFSQGLAGLMGLCINFSRNAALSAVMFIVFLGPMLDMGLITTFTVDIYPTHLRFASTDPRITVL